MARKYSMGNKKNLDIVLRQEAQKLIDEKKCSGLLICWIIDRET